MSVGFDRTFDETPVFLAPMAGISDLPFRDRVLGGGASFVVSEMVATAEILRGRPSARARAELALGHARTSVQLAGRDPALMAEGARIVEGEGAQVIDINLGCPARKVTNGLAGSALMRDPDRALAIIDAVATAVAVPVTLKMRLGWDAGQMNAPDIAARAEAAGVRMIVVHGRTRCQFYEGRADWEAIAAVKHAVRVPVVANGDIMGVDDARAALALSGADGIMIGRGARGRPWLPGAVAARINGRLPAPPLGGAALAALVCGHYEAMLGFYGRDLGMRAARKHLGWYLESVAGGAVLRARLLRLTDPDAVLDLLRRGLSDSPGACEEAA